MINKGSTIQDHKTALYPSSALLEQWLTFEFMSSFALASDILWVLPSQATWIKLIKFRKIRTHNDCSPWNHNHFATSSEHSFRRPDGNIKTQARQLAKVTFHPYVWLMLNWFSGPPKDRFLTLIKAENVERPFLHPINSRLEWFLTLQDSLPAYSLMMDRSSVYK